MKIKVSHLKDGLSTEVIKVKSETFGFENPDDFADDITVSMQIDRRGKDFYIQFDIDSELNLECDRCLEPLRQRIKGQTSTLYTPNEKLVGVDEEAVKLIAEGVAEIKIDDDVRDTVLLNLPFKALCTPECKGLCPQCGKNLNFEQCNCFEKQIDPRWEALLKLKNKNS